MARQMPYDQLWFIKAADSMMNFEWLGSYDKFTLIRPPGYPIWIWLVNTTGIPLRLATELLLLGSSFALIVSLKKAGFPSWLCCLIYFAMIFCPVTIPTNNEAESETLYTPLLYLSLAGLIMMLLTNDSKRAIFYSLLTGIPLCLLWNTRLEIEYILCLLGIFGLLDYLTLLKKKYGPRLIFKRLSIVIGIPCVFIVLSVFSIRILNFTYYGIFATSELFSQGFVSANKALLRIKPNHPKSYVPVPKDVRELAYTASPTLKKIQTYLEGEVGQYWIKKWSCEYNKISCEDIAGCFFWALRDSVDKAGFHSSGSKSDSYYQQVAKEINSACDKGSLPCRSIFNGFLGFLHPDSSVYLTHVPESFIKVIKMFAAQNPADKHTETVIPYSDEFDRVANRRTSIIPISPVDLKKQITISGPISMAGWTLSFDEPIKEVQLRDHTGKILGFSNVFADRPDVVAHFLKQGRKVPSETGFSLETSTLNNNYIGAKMAFLKKDGSETVIPLNEILKPNPSIAISIDAIGFFFSNPHLRLFLQWGIWYRYLLIFFSTIGLISLIILTTYIKHLDIATPAAKILILIASLIILRVALVAMLDASAFKIDLEYIRYLYPVMPLYSCFLALITYQALHQIKVNFRQECGENT